MQIIPATDKKYAYVIISDEERKSIEEEVKKELTQRVHAIFSNSVKNEEKKPLS